MLNSTADSSLISFDSDSPLSVKKKKKSVVSKTKRRGPKSHALIEEEKIVADNKRIAKKWAKKEKKPVKVKPLTKVKTPQGCKHILPAFKPFLTARWEMLKGSHAEAQTVGNYIQAAAQVCKDKRPQEYAELHTLAQIAKKIANSK